MPLVCYDLRLPVWSRNLNDYDLALCVTSQPTPHSLHWQALLAARVAENQVYVAGRNRVDNDGNGCHCRGNSQVVNSRGKIIATTDAHQVTHINVKLSMAVLREYHDRFPAWRDADEFRLR